MRLVETVGIQKKVLEEENEELKSRIQEMESMYSNPHTRVDHGAASNGALRADVPPLNIIWFGHRRWDQQQQLRFDAYPLLTDLGVTQLLSREPEKLQLKPLYFV